MRLFQLKQIVDTAFTNSGDGDVNVEFFMEDPHGEEVYLELDSIGQFGFIRDVVVKFKYPENEDEED